MPLNILSTKLHAPPLRPERVELSRLIRRLEEGVRGRLTLISAPAGFGKTTLVSSWMDHSEKQVAWVSLDEADNNSTRFLLYLIAAVQTILPAAGKKLADVLKTLQVQPSEEMLTELINETAKEEEEFVLVLDDYHVIDDVRVNRILDFFLHHGPTGMHLLIISREDPPFPLARLRGRGELTELRAADLRFSHDETADFFRRVMDIPMDEKDLAELERRTEGWVACLQMAALSMKDQKNISRFISSFSGSHRYVMDYLGEEVLHRQSEEVQRFLLCTSLLERFSAPLCDALLRAQAGKGREILSYLDRSNIFIVPLDDGRDWYRYHHLFAELLRKRLLERVQKGVQEIEPSELHLRASTWYEENRFELEAFHHAVAGNDVGRAARLAAGGGMPLHFRGAIEPVLQWLKALSREVMDRRPGLWVLYASALSMKGELNAVEEKLEAAEKAMESRWQEPITGDTIKGEAPGDGSGRTDGNLIGHIAAIRALIAGTCYRPDEIIMQSRRALEFLDKDNLPVRTATIWKLGWAHHLKGDRKSARECYEEAIATSAKTGNAIINISARSALGVLEEEDTRLNEAARIYQGVVKEVGETAQPFLSEVYLGLARIYYQWNDLRSAQEAGERALRASKLSESFLDRYAIVLVFLARVMVARGEIEKAASLVKEADEIVHENTIHHILELAAEFKVQFFLLRGEIEEAEKITAHLEIPLAKARIHLARNAMVDAMGELDTYYQQAQERGWPDEVLKTMVLKGIVLDREGKRKEAIRTIGDVLALSEPGGYIRLFLDEGERMAGLLSDLVADLDSGLSGQGGSPDYVRSILSAFQEERKREGLDDFFMDRTQASLTEPLSSREREVLALLAEGLSNREICDRLFLAMDTVKGHNRRIFGKLGVRRRTEAVARARKIGIL